MPESRRGKQFRIAMVSYSFYDADNRVMRYAETLAARGDHVDVISLARLAQSPAKPVGESMSSKFRDASSTSGASGTIFCRFSRSSFLPFSFSLRSILKTVFYLFLF